MSVFFNKLEPLIENKKHVIWDFNGTLLNDVNHTVSVVNSLLREHLLPTISVDDYKQIFRFPVIDYYIELGFDFSKESFESLCEKYIQRFMSGFKDSCQLVHEIEVSLQTLRQRLPLQSILSAAEQGALLEIVHHHKIAHYFDHIYGINTHYADSKVNRGLDLMQIAAYDPTETVIIGDTCHDLEVGKALGIDVILVGHGHQCVRRLQKYHDKVIEIQ